MSAPAPLQVWLAFDWDAPESSLRLLEAYLRSVRPGDPAELAVTIGSLQEEEAGARLLALIAEDPQLAPRASRLPEIVVHAGDVPDDVPDHLRLPGPGEIALHTLREELAPYVAVTPVLNQEEWARAWQPEPGFRHLVVDNASDDATAALLAERGAEVVVNERRLSRVDNWRHAVTVFLEQTKAPWMKWVFAGDRLLPGAADLLDSAIAAHPEVRLISAEYDVKQPDGRLTRFRGAPETTLVEPAEALYRFTLSGNWMGGPIALALHRDLLAQIEFGAHPFVADWQASLSLARRHPVLYVAEPVGVFDASRSRYHTAHERDVYATVQHVAMRYQALDALRELRPGADLAQAEEQLDSFANRALATRFKLKDLADQAPPGARVVLEDGSSAGGATRLRLGGTRVDKRRRKGAPR